MKHYNGLILALMVSLSFGPAVARQNSGAVIITDDASAPAVLSPLSSMKPDIVLKEKTPPPPTKKGVYVYHDCQGEGGCPNRYWRAFEPVSLLARHHSQSKKIGLINELETVEVLDVQTRLIPRRAIVTEDYKDMKRGEIVYLLEYEGEGNTTWWVKGAKRSYDDNAPQIYIEDQTIPEAIKPTLGLWAKVKRENGQIGWVNEIRFLCMSKLSGDDDCRD
jgi:hypothetical protein